jgi:hypothetical protein
MSSLSDNSSPPPPACHHHQPSSTTPVRLGWTNTIALVHAGACALQGLLLALLLDLNVTAAAGLFLCFAVLGAGLGLVWRYCTGMPHWLDMCLSMCSVGSCGMLLGIWTDHRFGPIDSLESLFWTYGFMLAACNVAMFAMTRCRHAWHWTDIHFLAMFLGGNLGMVAGMKAGQQAVTQLVNAAKPVELVGKLAGMTLGMVAGMMLGNAALLALLRRGRRLLSNSNAGREATREPGAEQQTSADKGSEVESG